MKLTHHKHYMNLVNWGEYCLGWHNLYVSRVRDALVDKNIYMARAHARNARREWEAFLRYKASNAQAR